MCIYTEVLSFNYQSQAMPMHAFRNVVSVCWMLKQLELKPDSDCPNFGIHICQLSHFAHF